MIKVTKEEFVKRAIKKHGEIYDYSEIDYQSRKVKVKIFCKKHQNYFWQYPSYHEKGTACSKCAKEKSAIRCRNKTTEEFIKEATTVHENRYDYSQVIYIQAQNKVKIICIEHGVFEQKPSKHLLGQGCPKCRFKRKTPEKFIEDCKIIHNDFYDYSKTNYITGKDKVDIICPFHGEFQQVASSHLWGKGCPDCGRLRKGSKKYRDKDLKRRLRSLSTRIRIYFRGKDEKKSENVRDIIGCSPEFLKEHLENNPYGFKVSDENMDLDHIIPMFEAETIEEAYKLNHYTNLQLLPSVYNRNVKREGMWNKKDFEQWLENNS